jgi:hypothetical protein
LVQHLVSDREICHGLFVDIGAIVLVVSSGKAPEKADG